MERELDSGDDEEGGLEYAFMDDCEIYVIFHEHVKIYHAFLYCYDHNGAVAFVLPLKKEGTDPLVLGQTCYDSLSKIIPRLEFEFAMVDEKLDVTYHEVTNPHDKDDPTTTGMVALTEKMKNNKVFMVLGHNTVQ